MLVKNSTCEIVIPYKSWETLPPTRKQLKYIERLRKMLHEDYIDPATRGQAVLMIQDMVQIIEDYNDEFDPDLCREW